MGRKFRRVLRKNYSRKAAKSSAKLSKDQADGFTSAIELPSNVSTDEAGSTVDIETSLNGPESFLDSTKNFNAATSTVELSSNDIADESGSKIDHEPSLEDDHGSTMQCNTADESSSTVELVLDDVDGKSTTLLTNTGPSMDHRDHMFTAEASTQTDPCTIKSVEVGPPIDGIFTSEASTQTEPADIYESIDGVQTNSSTFINPSTTLDSNLSLGNEPQQEMPYVMCEGNADEKFLPLVNKHKGVFKDASGT